MEEEKKPRLKLEISTNTQSIPLRNRYKADVCLKRIDKTEDGLTRYRLEIPEKEKDYVTASYKMEANNPLEITEYETVDPSGGPFIQKGNNVLRVVGDYDYLFIVKRITYDHKTRTYILYISTIEKYDFTWVESQKEEKK